MSKAVPESVTRLVEAFESLPGIGPKTASRLAYFLLRAPDDVSNALAQAVSELKTKTRLCSICYNITEEDPCPICQDNMRDSSIIAVVEEPLDALALERTGAFQGRYHVLHGVISPREGIGPDQLKIRELVKRVQQGGIHELIIGTNPGQQGDATAMIIQTELAKSDSESTRNVRLTRLARGLPTGADLEYADSTTVMRALQGRQAL
ncbi:MAG: recombination mediator RecR [Chloroflexota bacterium]